MTLEHELRCKKMKKIPRVRIVLVRPRNPHNIGACARAMANFGFSDLVVVDPYDPVWKETRSAPGAESIVLRAERVATIAAAVRGFPIRLGTSSFHQRPIEHAIVASPSLGSYLAQLPSDGVAIIFGSERSGLSNEELTGCRAVIQIPTNPETPSMNLGQAAAVVLYELARYFQSKEIKTSPAPVNMETLIKGWIDALESRGYQPGATALARSRRIRQAFHDFRPSPPSYHFFLSVARWILKKNR